MCSCSNLDDGWRNRDTWHAPFYHLQIAYQFQDINEKDLLWFIDKDGIPDKLPKLGSLERYQFTVNEETYSLYHSCIQQQNYFNTHYVYKGDLFVAEIAGGNRWASGGFLVKENYLYYCADSKLSSFKRLDVLTGITVNITKAQYEEQYYTIEPPPIKLPESKNYIPLDLSFVALDKNFQYTGCFVYNNETYYVDSNALGGIPGGGTLLKYSGDINQSTYTKIARMGKLPRGRILHGDYIYYWYGTEFWRDGKNGSDMKKQTNFTRMSLITFEHEAVTGAEYFEIWNSYEYIHK